MISTIVRIIRHLSHQRLDKEPESMFLNFISNDRNLDTFKSLGSKLCSKFVNFFSIDLQIDYLETFGSESN